MFDNIIFYSFLDNTIDEVFEVTMYQVAFPNQCNVNDYLNNLSSVNRAPLPTGVHFNLNQNRTHGQYF